MFWWPEWMTDGRCFGMGNRLGGEQREVVGRNEHGQDLLECGHAVLTLVVDEEFQPPAGSYRRTCNHCAPMPKPDIFHPKKGGMSYEYARRGKAVCEPCPVREQCLEYAMDNGIRYGVWGGLSQRERRALAAGIPAELVTEVESYGEFGDETDADIIPFPVPVAADDAEDVA